MTNLNCFQPLPKAIMQDLTVDKKKGAGRPVKHLTLEEKKAANVHAARQYRSRKKEERLARRDLRKPLNSKAIDLSAADPLWKKQPSRAS